jgi:hypothetical protein
MGFFTLLMSLKKYNSPVRASFIRRGDDFQVIASFFAFSPILPVHSCGFFD